MTIYFASLRLCVKFGSQSREDAKIIKDHICEKHSTTNLFCGMVLVTDSHIVLFTFFISSILFFNYSKKATLNFNREKANSTKIITLDSINSTENKADLNKKDTLSKIKTFAIKQEKLKQIDMSYAKDYETQIATKTVSDSIKKDEIPKVIVIKKQIIKRDTVYVDK